MSTYIRNPLTYAWAFLTAITILSWLISRGGEAGYDTNLSITLSVLLIAAVKTQLVIRYFMEVRTAPFWLKRVTNSWVVVLFLVLLIVYWTYM